MAICNNYKDTIHDLINNLDTKSPDRLDSPDWPGPINKGLRNALKSRGGLPTLLEEEPLDKDDQIPDSQVHQCHDVATLGPKSGRAQYGNNSRSRENGKNNKGGEYRKRKRGGRDYWGNKLDPGVEKSSGSETSDYFHKIYRY